MRVPRAVSSPSVAAHHHDMDDQLGILPVHVAVAPPPLDESSRSLTTSSSLTTSTSLTSSSLTTSTSVQNNPTTHGFAAMLHKTPTSMPTTEFYGHHYTNAEILDLGLEWNSMQDAKDYVYAYASRNGFVALTTSTTKDKRHCIMACNRKGSCKSRSKGVRSRRSQKCGCRWHVNIWYRNPPTIGTTLSSSSSSSPGGNSSSGAAAKYRITSAFLKHNHALRNPEETTKIAAKRHSSMVLKQEARARQQTTANGVLSKTKTSSAAISISTTPLESVTSSAHPALDQVQYFGQEIVRLAHVVPVPEMVEDIALQLQLLVRTTEHAIQMNASAAAGKTGNSFHPLSYTDALTGPSSSSSRAGGTRKRKADEHPTLAAEEAEIETHGTLLTRRV